MSPYLAHGIYLYDHPELRKISEFAIKTDNFIFLDSKKFEKMSLPEEGSQKTISMDEILEKYNPEELNELKEELNKPISNENNKKFLNRRREKINNLKNIKFIKGVANDNRPNELSKIQGISIKNPIVKMKDEEFFELLKQCELDNAYDFLNEELIHIKNHGLKSLLLQNESIYISNFKNKIFPDLIFKYNKYMNSNDNLEANGLLDYFTATIASEIKDFSMTGYSLIVSNFARSNIQEIFEIEVSEKFLYSNTF